MWTTIFLKPMLILMMRNSFQPTLMSTRKLKWVILSIFVELMWVVLLFCATFESHLVDLHH